MRLTAASRENLTSHIRIIGLIVTGWGLVHAYEHGFSAFAITLVIAGVLVMPFGLLATANRQEIADHVASSLRLMALVVMGIGFVVSEQIGKNWPMFAALVLAIIPPLFAFPVFSWAESDE